MTHSSFAVGAIGLAVAVPMIVIGLLGGSFADAFDRRKLVLVTSSGLALFSVAFAVQAAANLRQLWLLYLLISLQTCLFSVDQPARLTFMPRLLGPDRMPAATALTQVSFQLTGTVGPLLAGVVIATAGLKTAYAVDAATFVCSLYAVARLRPMPPDGGGARPGFAAVAEGLRWVRHQPVIAMTFLVDLNAMIFGMPRALFPALAATHFGGGARTVGLLYAAPAIGGLLGAAFSGPLKHVRRQGMAVLVSVALWGGSIAGFGMTRSLTLGGGVAGGGRGGRHGQRRLPPNDLVAGGARCVAGPAEQREFRRCRGRPAAGRRRIGSGGRGHESRLQRHQRRRGVRRGRRPAGVGRARTRPLRTPACRGRTGSGSCLGRLAHAPLHLCRKGVLGTLQPLEDGHRLWQRSGGACTRTRDLPRCNDFDVYEVLEKAPSCVIVADEAAQIVFQNAAARKLSTATAAKHGDALLIAVRAALTAVPSGTTLFRFTTTVAAQTTRGHAHADVTVDQLGRGSWPAGPTHRTPASASAW